MKSLAAVQSGSRNFNFVWVMLLAALAALPLLAILALALGHSTTSWPANLSRLIWNTIAMCGGAGLIALAIGTFLAWLVSFYRFPGRKFLKWMALLPLALPGYIISFVYVETFTYAGPVQQGLRDVFGWVRPDDYWFPDIRSTAGAMLVMGFALYPYVYLAGLSAFIRQPMNEMHVARTLGRSPLQAFLQVALPQARPALFIGMLLVVMESVNDIGAATFFGVGTLTTAVYSTWLDQGDLAGAAQMAMLLITFMALLVYFETVAKARVLRDGKNVERIVLTELTSARGALASIGILMPITLGFFIPLLMLITMGMRRFSEVLSFETLGALTRSSYLALLACIVTLTVALVLSQLLRGQGGKSLRAVTRLSSLGYALPGTVLGIGVLVPFGQFDQWINRVAISFSGAGPGLLLSGGIFVLVFAYATRFLIIAVSHVEDGMEKIPSNYDHVARTLGRSKAFIFRSIHLPLLKPSIVSAMLLVFVDAMKELPATLILRPFDFETLATRVFSLASLGQYESAAIPAFLIVFAGFIPVMVLSCNLRHATSSP